ncbi:exonuclease domain-containing protein [Microvirga terrae]|uniref:Exonuclease domain-containing protein n=1 Tax=Microvirga terrae TaxID=2740529 RepID=A0ABY5RMJ7_9HYPH|nr:exonuclease domain-containing protein [Microvirga terrae]UVF18451.1 exonuclease domain-containing protein [Microvirga terrae]
MTEMNPMLPEIATLHPADELANIRETMRALRSREQHLCQMVIDDRAVRFGRAAYVYVSEQRTRDGHIEPVVTSYPLPTLEEALALLTQPLLVIDMETTGLYPARGDRVLSMAMLTAMHYYWPDEPGSTSRSRAGVVSKSDEWLRFFDPEGRRSTPEAERVHGLTESLLEGFLPFAKYQHEIHDALDPFWDEKPVLLGHNILFDISFLNAELALCGRGPIQNAFVDTWVISKLLWPEAKASLDALCERLGVDRSSRDKCHEALTDCRLVAQCIPGLVAEIENRMSG